MSLDDTLARRRPPEPPALPNLKTLATAAERVLHRWPDAAPAPPERDREQLVRRMEAHRVEDRWDEVAMSLVTAAGRAVFDAARRGRPDLAELRDFYVAEIRASHRTTFLGAMVSAYLESFVPDAPTRWPSPRP